MVTLTPTRVSAQDNPNLMLLEGAYLNDVHMLLNALIQHANIDTTTEEGATALHMAVAIGNIDMVKILLYNGASTEIYDNAKMTPLMIAVRWDRDTITDLLLQAGANYKLKNSEGKDAFFQAVETGNLIPADILLYYGATIESFDSDSISALSKAILNLDYQMFDYLLSKGAEPNTHDLNGISPLLYAALLGDTTIMRKLLNAGAHPQHTDHMKKGIIEYTFESGNTNAFQWMLENIDGVKKSPVVKKMMDEAYRNRYDELLYNLKNKRKYTSLTPIAGGVNVQWQLIFNGHDMMMGPYFAFAENKYRVQIGLGMACRFWDKRILTGYMLGGPSMQLWEDRTMIFFNQKKAFSLIRNIKKHPILLANIGLFEGYSWGSYRGMSYEPWVGWMFSPSFGIQLNLGNFYMGLDLISIDTRSYPVRNGKIEFGAGWKIPFKKHSVL